MFNRKKQVASGFTLVEVVIAVAVMGLITIIMVIAYMQLTNAKQNNALKTDAARVLAAARQWTSEHNGVLPSSQADWTTDAAAGNPTCVSTNAPGGVCDYITKSGASFISPLTGQTYAILYSQSGAPAYTGFNQWFMFVASPATCANNLLSPLPATGGSRQIAVETKQAGSQGTYCISQ